MKKYRYSIRYYTNKNTEICLYRESSHLPTITSLFEELMVEVEGDYGIMERAELQIK